jgi:hypothetical protein
MSNVAQITAAIEKGFTVTRCLSNCSNNGVCVISSSPTIYTCDCFQDYTGKTTVLPLPI